MSSVNFSSCICCTLLDTSNCGASRLPRPLRRITSASPLRQLPVVGKRHRAQSVHVRQWRPASAWRPRSALQLLQRFEVLELQLLLSEKFLTGAPPLWRIEINSHCFKKTEHRDSSPEVSKQLATKHQRCPVPPQLPRVIEPVEHNVDAFYIRQVRRRLACEAP